MESILTDRLSTLSHPHRLSVFRLLMRRYPDDVPAGEIADALALKPSTASVYLSALTQVQLITQRRDGTRLLYRVNLDAARDVVAGLFFDCCQGRPDICPPKVADLIGCLPRTDHKPFNVLFVCTGNSARSIIAETVLRDLAGDRFTAFSAGTAHRSSVNLRVLDLLRANGHDVSTLRSKNISEFQVDTAPKMDFMFTVCDHAANEDCPTWPGAPLASHWGMPDPSLVTGIDAQKRLAFQHTYGALRNRLTAFTALPFDTLERSALQGQIDALNTAPITQDLL